MPQIGPGELPLPYPPTYPRHPADPFGKEGYAYNPAGSMPAPPPRVSVPGLWYSSKIPLSFGAGTDPVYRTATWRTPIFDLRPDLRGVGGGSNRAVPVWRPGFGAGGKLWVQISGWNSTASARTGLRVIAREYAHIIEDEALVQVDDDQDVTSEVVGTAPSSLLAFVPPGSGYPVRYWRLSLTFDFTEDHDDPNLVIQAAYY